MFLFYFKCICKKKFNVSITKTNQIKEQLKKNNFQDFIYNFFVKLLVY